MAHLTVRLHALRTSETISMEPSTGKAPGLKNLEIEGSQLTDRPVHSARAKEDAMYRSILSGEKPTVEDDFSATVKSAMESVVSSDENSILVEKFYLAYKFRSQFPWLIESGKLPEEDSGLTGAFRYALSSYVAAYEPKNHFENEISEGLSLPVDLLKESVSRAIDDRVALAQFSNALARQSLYAKDAEVDSLAPHIRRALIRYCERRESGTTPDPW
ncbi:hypothetical protein ACFY96_11850 [Streptomyces massasporeus]